MPSARPYARVSDGLATHAKVSSIPRSIRAEAMGTWVLALSWSNEHLTDGHIPAHMVENLSGTEAGALALVEAGLWRRRRGGYVFVNWAEHQSTREQVEQRREANRERQNRHRGKKRENPGDDNAGVTRDKGVSNTPSSSQSSSLTTTQEIDLSGGDLSSAIHTSRPDSAQPVENVDSMRPDPERIAVRASELIGEPVDTLTAGLIAEHYLERAQRPPRMATRYVVTCMNREDPAVLANYVHTGRWSA